MKWNEAVKIGKECGLTEPKEFMMNIEVHAPSLFNYEDMNKELKELWETAKQSEDWDKL